MSLGEFEIPTFENSVRRLDQPSQYLIKKAKFKADGYDSLKKSMTSCTLYVGKLSTDTTEEQLYELFSKCGIIKQIIMGLDRFKKTPCGFCFIVYQEAKGALSAMKYLNHTMLDGNKMEIDLDPGFVEGRQFGRGADGGQYKKGQFPTNRGGMGNNGRGGYRNNGGYPSRGNPRFNNPQHRAPQRSGFFSRRQEETDSFISPAFAAAEAQRLPPQTDSFVPPPSARRILEPRSGTLPPARPRVAPSSEERPPHMDIDDDVDVDRKREHDDEEEEELPPHLR